MQVTVPITTYKEVNLTEKQVKEITIQTLKEAWAKMSTDLKPYMWIKDGKVYEEKGDYHSDWDEVVREATKEEIDAYNTVLNSIALLN